MSSPSQSRSSGTLHTKPKGVCLNAGTPTPCKWPRCDCRVDVVYMKDCHIPRPQR